MPEIGMLRVMWRELETGSRTSIAGHEGGNPGYRQGMVYRVTAPALDPTTLYCSLKENEYREFQSIITPWERETLLLNV